MSAVSHAIDHIDVTFDDETLVADAGMIVPATLMVRLGLEALIDSTVRLVGRVGGARPGRKVLTLVAAILVGGSHIDHAERFRAGSTQAVLPFGVMAPSTLGTFLRAFTFGHIRQLDRVIAEAVQRAWALGAGPGAGPVTMDLDSTICEVHGKAKGGAAYGYTKVFGYHPLVATRADSGEVLHARLRKGTSQRGAKRFAEELVARVRRAGAPGPPEGAGRRRVLELRAVGYAQPSGGGLVGHGAHQPPDPGLHRQHRRRRVDPDRLPRRRRGPRRGGGLRERQRPPGAAPAPGGAPHPAHRRAPKPSCGPTGATTRSSPTSPWEPSPWTSSTAITPRSSSPSATSKKGPGSSTAPRGGSSPTPPGWPAPSWPQPDPLDRPPRPRPPPRSTHRHPHHPHPPARPARPPRQPQPTMDAAAPELPPAGRTGWLW